jgi:hypothetical protein
VLVEGDVMMRPALRLGMLALGAVLATACAGPVPSPVASLTPHASRTPAAPTPALTPPAGGVPSGSPDPTPAPSEAMAPALEGRLTCGEPDLEFDAEALDRPAGADLGLTPPAAALRAYLAADTPDEGSLPKTGWRAVIEEPRRVVYLARDGDGWSMASFVLGDDGTWTDWDRGSCRLAVVLPEGIGFAEWRLDPSNLPGPDATTVHVLASELACASGKAPIGRMLAPIVLENDEAVTIALEVRTRPGGQDCPGNPEVPVDVELAAPLGTRGLFDGSTVPPSDQVPLDTN